MIAGLKIRKGDTVIVVTGKDKGKKGEVLRSLPKDDLVVVQGINVVKRHQRPSTGNPGGIQEKELPIHVSNLALVDPKSGDASRIGWKFLDDGRKVRFARKSGEVIDT